MLTGLTNLTIARLIRKTIADDQTFLNIVKNAIEAMKKGRSLTVLTGVSREYVKQKGRVESQLNKGTTFNIYIPFEGERI